MTSDIDTISSLQCYTATLQMPDFLPSTAACVFVWCVAFYTPNNLLRTTEGGEKSIGCSPMLSATTSASITVTAQGKVKCFMQMLEIIDIQLEFNCGQVVSSGATFLEELQDECQFDL